MATGTGRLNDLEPYVSPAYRRLVLRRGGAALGADAEVFRAVALFADISGFSALTTMLSARGPGGAEELSIILNDRFGRLVDLVYLHGGEVLAFAGDAAVAYWSVGGDAPRVARQATQCGHAIRDAVQGTAGPGGIPIRLRVGIGAGQVLCALVGGVDGRWHSLMGGDAWTEMLQALAAARPGEVILAPSVQRLVGAVDTGDTLDVSREADVEATPAADALRAGVPRSVQKRVDAGQQGWLAEFLTVTTAFVHVPGLCYDSEVRLAELQRVASTMQAAVHRFGGSVNDLLVDDKGTVLIAVWGVPLHTYEDNGGRATLAALAIRDDLRALDIGPAIGITTGRAFAGPVGNARRMRYGLFGETVILAARLMQAAEDRILCDTATRAGAHKRVRFGPSQPIRVKGRGEVGTGAVALEVRTRATRAFVGREVEERVMSEALASVERRGESRLVVIRGEPGIGKSTLVSAFLRGAQASNVRVLVGTGDSMAQSSPYHAWRAVFEALGVPHADLASTLASGGSAEATRDLLTQLFHRARGETPAALVLEDAHWIDSASWSLAADIHRTAERLLLLVVIRPMTPADMSDDCRRLLAHEQARTVDLGVLARDEAVELACRRLDVDALPDAVADLIRSRGEGHPLFTEQLVQALLERGVIRVDGHDCRADPGIVVPEFPETVQGLIRSRIDLLTPEEQFTLKVASIFGRTFEIEGLLEVHPLRGDDTLEPQLTRMARLDLLEMQEGSDPAPTPTRAFKHGIIQEVAYGTLSFEQRRRLHHAAAEWYERTRQDAPDAYPVLARHWSEAGVTPKALWYLERAGEQALRTGNYRETVTLLSQALTTAKDAPPDLAPPAYRVGAWLRQLGQAHYALGRLGEARAHLERAAATFGFPIPASRIRQAAAILRGSLSPWIPGIPTRRRLDPKLDPAGAALYEAASALDTVSAIYYLNQDALLTAYCLARRFELLGRLVPTDLFARCSAEMAFLWEYLGIHRQADRFFEQGWDTANALQAPLTSARVLYSWSVFDLGRGNWAQGKSRAHLSASIYEQFGEQRLRRDSELMEVNFDTFTGALADGAAMYERLLMESTPHEDLLHIGWSCFGLGKIRRREGRLAEALHYLDQGLQAARNSGDRVTQLTFLGTRASARAAAGDSERAAEDIRTATQQIGASRVPSAFMLTEGYAGVAEAALTLLAYEGHGVDRSELDRAAAMACTALRRGARIFPAARPTALLWTGVHRSLHGHSRSAERCWRQALTAAERIGLPFEEGLIRFELGRLLQGRTGEGDVHLTRARELFLSLGAAHELKRLDRAQA